MWCYHIFFRDVLVVRVASQAAHFDSTFVVVLIM